jgi:hypothetical protein
MRLAGAWQPQPGPQAIDGVGLAMGGPLGASARPIPNTDTSLRALVLPHEGHVASLASALLHVNSSKRCPHAPHANS